MGSRRPWGGENVRRRPWGGGETMAHDCFFYMESKRRGEDRLF